MTYRPIATSDRVKRDAATGPMPTLQYLPIGKLLIDGDYQRPLNAGNWSAIEKIADTFDWAHFTPIIAAPVDGDMFCIIDGQHRAHAAMLVGATELPAMVVNLTTAGQARAFSTINGQVTGITLHHIYRSALVAMEPWALACRDAVGQAGCQLMTHNSSTAEKKPREIYTIALIRRHVAAGNGPMVTAGLDAMVRCPCAEDPLIWNNSFLSPWLQVLQTRPKALGSDLTGFLQRYDPHWILTTVQDAHAQPDLRGMSRMGVVQRVMGQMLDLWMKGSRP